MLQTGNIQVWADEFAVTAYFSLVPFTEIEPLSQANNLSFCVVWLLFPVFGTVK
jgi:hypothetical protein